MPNPCRLKLDAVRARMSERRVTQHELAETCGIDVRTVQRWFAGQSVSLASAERVAALLGVGTTDLFTGVPEEAALQVSGRLRVLQRMLSARDNAFAQGVRLVEEFFDGVLQAVSFEAHPTRGFVSRHPLQSAERHGFLEFSLRCPARHAELAVRCQVGRRFGFVTARIRLHEREASLVEVWQTHSMTATRSAEGGVRLLVWVGPESREVIFVSDREFAVTRAAAPLREELCLDEPGNEHVLCVRPTATHLRAAGLPMGFDRIHGTRAGRVDVPIHWDAAAARA